MDPITAAGMALSITSLALQVFAGCMRGYQMFVETVDMPENFEHLRTRLKIEQTRLLNWGENIGLAAELLEYPSHTLKLNQNLILDILVQVQAAFEACVKIESNFGEVVSQTAGTPASSNPKQMQKKSFLRRTLAVLENPARLSASLKWAMIKQDEFERLTVKLIGYNDAVCALLDRHALHEVRIMQQQTNLVMLQLAEHVSELRNITAAMAIRPAGGKPLSMSSLSRSHTLVDDDQAENSTLAALASFKAQQLSIENSNSASSELLISPLDLPQPFDKSDSPKLFDFRGSKAWVEWREPVEEDLDQQLLQVMEERVKRLAKLLSQPSKPSEFRAPRCLGYVCEMDDADEPQYGFVYEVPAQKKPPSSDQRMNNLRHLFLTMPCASLTKRMRLARMVAESLFYLHTVNWLHKGLRSKGIVFFTDVKQKQTDLSSLVVSGFDFSRPDLPEEVTVRHPSNIFDDLYRHPERLKDASSASSAPRSQKSHDVYSLGIILLEIAFWQPIEDVMGIAMDRKSARSSIRKIRENILDDGYGKTFGKQSIKARLEGQVGEVYAEVVRRCVQGGEAIGVDADDGGPDIETDPKTGVKMQQVFFDEILSKLQALRF